MENTIITWLLLILLAFFMGFVANRTTLCAVRAVDEVMNKHQTKVLSSFFRVMLWSLVISMFATLVFDESTAQEYNFTVVAMLGGLVFGLGATINGGCALHTLSRLGTGDFGMILTILGLTSGAILTKQVLLKYTFLDAIPTVSNISLPEKLHLPLTILLLMVLVLELIQTRGGINMYKWTKRLFSPKYDLRSAAAI